MMSRKSYRVLVLAGLMSCVFAPASEAAQPGWVDCWHTYMDLFSGGQDWKDLWYYDGTCGYVPWVQS